MVGAQANTIVVDDRRWGHGMIMIDAEATTENAIAVEYCKGNSKGGRRIRSCTYCTRMSSAEAKLKNLKTTWTRSSWHDVCYDEEDLSSFSCTDLERFSSELFLLAVQSMK